MLVQQDSQNVTVGVFVRRADQTGYTGILPSTLGFAAYYIRENSQPVKIQLDPVPRYGVGLTYGSVKYGICSEVYEWTELDPVRLPGYYRLGVPDGALLPGSKYVDIILHGADSMVPVSDRIDIVEASSQPTNPSYTYTVKDISGNTVEGASVLVARDKIGTRPVGPAQISVADGRTMWQLPQGTYYVFRTKQGVQFSNPDIWKIEN